MHHHFNHHLTLDVLFHHSFTNHLTLRIQTSLSPFNFWCIISSQFYSSSNSMCHGARGKGRGRDEEGITVQNWPMTGVYSLNIFSKQMLSLSWQLVRKVGLFSGTPWHQLLKKSDAVLVLVSYLVFWAQSTTEDYIRAVVLVKYIQESLSPLQCKLMCNNRFHLFFYSSFISKCRDRLAAGTC